MVYHCTPIKPINKEAILIEIQYVGVENLFNMARKMRLKAYLYFILTSITNQLKF